MGRDVEGWAHPQKPEIWGGHTRCDLLGPEPKLDFKLGLEKSDHGFQLQA